MSESNLDHYRSDFARLDAGFSGDRNGHGWLHQIRKSALDLFMEEGFPTQRDEEWRFTDVAPIARKRFLEVDSGKVNSVEQSLVDSLLFPAGSAYQLVFVNGEYSDKLSQVENLPDGVEISNLATILASNPKRLEPYLARHADPRSSPFTAWNTAFMREGAYLNIPSGAILDRPIHLVYLFLEASEPTVVHPRNLIVTGSNAQATIVESYVSLSDSVYLTNTVTEIVWESIRSSTITRFSARAARRFISPQCRRIRAGAAVFSLSASIWVEDLPVATSTRSWMPKAAMYR